MGGTVTETAVDKINRWKASSRGNEWPDHVIEAAKVLAQELPTWKAFKVEAVDAFPGRDGQIIVTAYLTGGVSVDFEVRDND